MKNRVIDVIIAFEFLAMILVALFSFNLKQGKVSEAENRTLAAFPLFFGEDGELSETLLQDLNLWFQDNIGLRDQLINLSSIISFNVMNQSTSEKVEIGKAGWLYFNSEGNMDIAKDTYRDFDEKKLEAFCKQLVAVQQKLKNQGREFVFVIPPSKVSIYPEYIQSGDYEIGKTPADVLADYIEEHSSVNVIRLKDTLLEAKKTTDDLLYFKTDTHWNCYGRYLGYKAIIESLNNWGMIDTKPVEAEFYQDGPYSGDLAGMMGVVDFAGNRYSEATFQNIKLINSGAKEIHSGNRYSTYESKYGLENGAMWENDKLIQGKKLLLYGDSMIGNKILDLMAENFKETTFVWSYVLSQNKIDYIDPDIVMLDVSERFLNVNFPELFDNYLNIDVKYDSKSQTIDVYYNDDGQYAKMFFAIWSEDGGQDDLVWHEAERAGHNSWHVTAEVKDNKAFEKYNIHIYDGPSGKGKFICSTTYNILNDN